MNLSDYSIGKDGDLLYEQNIVVGFKTTETAGKDIKRLERVVMQNNFHHLIQPVLIEGENNILLHKLFYLLEKEFEEKQDIQGQLSRLQNGYTNQKYLFLAAKNFSIAFWYRTSSIEFIATLKALFRSYEYQVSHKKLLNGH